MDVKRVADRHHAGPPADGDIRARIQQLTLRQQRFERRVARDLGVDLPGLEALDHLISAGPSSPTELARRLDISTAATSLVLNRLEAAGHIRRERHPTDGRKLVVTAAEDSVDAADRLVAPLIGGVETLVGSLSEQESATVLKFLDALIQVYDQGAP
ncbi:MarR family winged helix-turn-helix transcriptional regulator [Actinoplanes sp. L3-i22]|uniref:MarR family winged helix-turn-helix transcriptional regulator n=1 Tax=Actinoplanes sp. L3-i22 TaxID=2836373 RepID=UPI001C8637CD|nr:MarR family transcriptional regulator [Actinoplanes sp. L3-i22]